MDLKVNLAIQINKSLPDGYSNKDYAYFAICFRRGGDSSMNKNTEVMLM